MSFQDNIKIDFKTALKVLLLFVKKNDLMMETTKEKIQKDLTMIFAEAFYKIAKYREKYKINLQKPELLRDVCFLSAAYIQKANPNSVIVYHAIIKACVAIVTIGAKKKFDDSFVRKLLKTRSSYMSQDNFLADIFYLQFKSHFRTKRISKPIK